MIKHPKFTNLLQFHIVYILFLSIFVFIENILVVQNEPVQPGSQFEQVPFWMWQVLCLQLLGQCCLQPIPYTSNVLQPTKTLKTM